MNQLDLFSEKELTKHEINMKMLDLHHRGEHSEEDRNFIRIHLKREHFKGLYYTWRQVRRNGKYYGFAILSDAQCNRRAAVFKSIDIIHERPITDKEFEAEVVNYGCNNRILIMWDFEKWESVVSGDTKWGAQTPKEVIEAYKQFNPQTIIDKKK